MLVSVIFKLYLCNEHVKYRHVVINTHSSILAIFKAHRFILILLFIHMITINVYFHQQIGQGWFKRYIIYICDLYFERQNKGPCESETMAISSETASE